MSVGEGVELIDETGRGGAGGGKEKSESLDLRYPFHDTQVAAWCI